MNMYQIAAVVLVFIAMAMIVDWIKRQARRISVLDGQLVRQGKHLYDIMAKYRADYERLVAELDQRGVIQGGCMTYDAWLKKAMETGEIAEASRSNAVAAELACRFTDQIVMAKSPVNLRQMERTIEALLLHLGLKMVHHPKRWKLEKIELNPGAVGTGPVVPS